ncbi:hypothetical protein HQ533_06290 [Candidatus Woesearchaeota archaeon]|nr:hypothetical protein [Candidatus Woesearchaeota archaeon]
MAKTKESDFYQLVAYINKLSGRISEIEDESKDVLKESSKKGSELKKIVAGLKSEIEQLKKASGSAKEIIERQKNIISNLAKNFKDITKDEQFERLKGKIDAWGPDRIATRKELKKSL